MPITCSPATAPARSWPCRVTTRATSSSPPSSTCPSSRSSNRPQGTDWRGYVDDGVSVNSASAEISIGGLPTPEAKRKITAWLESKGLGKKTINYKLRDWLFSRQRYWGEPFPIIWKTGPDGQPYHEALPESALPLLPPPLDDYKPTPDGQPPLARAKDWVNLPDGSKRETNTMPQWAGSCWYYLRYLDARNDRAFCGPEAERYWMGAAGAPKSGQSSIRKPQASTNSRPALTSTSAAPSTPSCTSSTPASGTRCSSTSATSPRLSHSSSSSTRA